MSSDIINIISIIFGAINIALFIFNIIYIILEKRKSYIKDIKHKLDKIYYQSLLPNIILENIEDLDINKLSDDVKLEYLQNSKESLQYIQIIDEITIHIKNKKKINELINKLKETSKQLLSDLKYFNYIKYYKKPNMFKILTSKDFEEKRIDREKFDNIKLAESYINYINDSRWESIKLNFNELRKIINKKLN